MTYLKGDIIGIFKNMPVPTQVTYYPKEDPYAMSFIFRTPEPVQWTFSRDLLIEGLEVPAGIGDVKFRPEEDSIVMEISSDEGEAAEFTFKRADIENIVGVSLTMMPQGQETEAIDWTRELAGILDDVV